LKKEIEPFEAFSIANKENEDGGTFKLTPNLLKFIQALLPQTQESGCFLSDILSTILTLAGKVTNKLSTSVSLKMAERSEANRAKRSFASKYLNFF